MDEGNGLTYIRARYYSPELGRFITKDLLTGKDGDGQSLNRYVYAVNNPVRYIDADGKIVGAIIAGILIVAIVAPSVSIIVQDIAETVKNKDNNPSVSSEEQKEIDSLVDLLTKKRLEEEYKKPTYFNAKFWEPVDDTGALTQSIIELELRVHREAKKEAGEIYRKERIDGIRKQIEKVQGNIGSDGIITNNNTPYIPEKAETQNFKNQTFKK